jgi:xanthine dehydrogenase accessory factor
LPSSLRVSKIPTDDPPAQVAQLPADAFVLCMTMGHRTDRPILEEIFKQQRTFPYLGVIGSKAKRAVLRRELRAAGVPAGAVDSFQCPIGLDLGNNSPGEIAISIAAQLLQRRDAWRAQSQPT